jgi:hypothetical protein
MSVSLKINGSTTVNYLVHSLDIELEYELTPAWFVSMHYLPIGSSETNAYLRWWKKWLLLPSKGAVKLVVNGDQQFLTLIRWNPFPQRLVVPLRSERIKIKPAEGPSLLYPKVAPSTLPLPALVLSPATLPECLTLVPDLPLKKIHLNVVLPLEELEKRLLNQHIH